MILLCTRKRVAGEKVKLEEMASKKAWAVLMLEAEQVFAKIASLGGGLSQNSATVTKPELVTVHGGDFGLFEEIDLDANGFFDIAEWNQYIKNERAERGDAKSLKFVNILFNTFNKKASEYARKLLEQAEFGRLRKETEVVFGKISSMGGGDQRLDDLDEEGSGEAALTKTEMLKAQGTLHPSMMLHGA